MLLYIEEILKTKKHSLEMTELVSWYNQSGNFKGFASEVFQLHNYVFDSIPRKSLRSTYSMSLLHLDT